MKRTILASIAAGMLALAIGQLSAAPKPSVVPTNPEIDFEFQTPRWVMLRPPGEDAPRRFWYLKYKVANLNLDKSTGQPIEVSFFPEFTMYTDSGTVVPAGKNVPTAVFSDIRKIENDPMLRQATGMTGKLLYGADNAKYGLAIWPDIPKNVGTVSIFVGGLSEETLKVDLPKPVVTEEIDPETGKTQEVTRTFVVLAKTLKLTFQIPGEAASRGKTQPKLLKKEWVMR